MKRLFSFLIFFGILAILISSLIFILTFGPALQAEIGYKFNDLASSPTKVILPVDEEFGIVIPKIGANSKVVANIDPYSEKDYQLALTKGVVQAKDSALPGEEGNIFIFSHSSANFYEAAKYNSVFYLLSKLEKEDEVYLFYQGQKFKYKVTGKVIADPSDLSYLTKKTSQKVLTLMTCWPPGTAYKRLIVMGRLD